MNLAHTFGKRTVFRIVSEGSQDASRSEEVLENSSRGGANIGCVGKYQWLLNTRRCRGSSVESTTVRRVGLRGTQAKISDSVTCSNNEPKR
jgi:hypothetical protein